MVSQIRFGRFLLPLAILLLSGCGGQASAPANPSVNNSGDGLAILDGDVVVKGSHSKPDISTPLNYGTGQRDRRTELQSNTELPAELQGVAAIPWGEGELAGPGQKIVSAIQDLDPTGVYIDSGDLTYGVGTVGFTPGVGQLSWAMYKIALSDGGYPASISLAIDTYSPGGPGSGFYVLVANYTTGRWFMSPLYTTNGKKTIVLPTVQNLMPQNYASPMNNMFVALLVYNGASVTVNGFSQDTNTRPQALIVETNNVYVRPVDQEFQFTNESEDSDNTIASQSWDYNGDDIEDASQNIVNVSFPTPGIHEVRMTCYDSNGGWDRDSIYVYTYDTDESMLPDEFLEALNETDPDPVPPPDVPLPGLGYDETFEWLLSDRSQEWWEIPEATNLAGWKNFVENDGLNNQYLDTRCWLPYFGSYAYDDHTAMLPFSNALGQTVRNWPDLQSAVQTGAWLHGVPVVNEGIVDDLDDEDPLAFAIKRLMNDYPDPNHDATFAQIQAEVAGVDQDFQVAMGRLVNAIGEALPYREAFLDPANTLILQDPQPGGTTWQQVFFDESLGMVVSHDNLGPGRAYSSNGLSPQNFDYANLYQGAAVLAEAIDEFHVFLDDWAYAGPSFDFDIRTSLGNIRVTGDGDDVINNPDWEGSEDGWYLLQVDIGGHDDYHCHAGGNADLGNPAAICIDYKGDDEYFPLDDPGDVDRTIEPSNDDTHQQGSGRMGWGFLLDREGNDTYGSVRLSQGCSDFGVGILQDAAGDDQYEGEAMCQGASLVGIGILLDEEGTDSYSSIAFSQGFGSLRGVGILSDRGIDNDSYFVDGNYNAAMPEYGAGDMIHNTNLSQGSALGKSPSGDASDSSPDPFVASGGLGLLNDEDGNDTYTAGSFAQAASFREGTGMLLDHAGNDTYNGETACGSASVQLSSTMLWDYSGNDQYLYSGMWCGGVGSVTSSAWFMESDGDDIYEANQMSFGLGLQNGFAYFVDWAGADSYELINAPMRASLGTAYIGELDPNDWDVTPTLGILVDILGADTYILPEAVKDRDGNTLDVADDKIWVRAKHTVLEPGWHNYEYGVGADGNWNP